MAPPRKNGSGSPGSVRLPRSELPLASRRFIVIFADGPVAVTSAAERAARLPESPADRLPQLPDVPGGRAGHPLAGGTAAAPRSAWRTGPQVE